MNYLDNVKAWLIGYGRFEEIEDWKPGYGPDKLRWKLLYTFNHGTRALSGGAVVTWSRWFYLQRRELGSAAFLTRLLNFVLGEDHGKDSADPMWGTSDTPHAVAGAVIFWTLVVATAGLLAWRAIA